MKEASKYNYNIHYAIKANANPDILKIINSYKLGADCVSGNEINRAIETGFPSNKIVYAGVGKSDKEIINAINKNIYCFNCESIPEIKIINEIAKRLNSKRNIAIRINPNINAKTHKYITTGTKRNKFGINIEEIEEVLTTIKKCTHINLIGLHFHIGSQITDMEVFTNLCLKINSIQEILIDEKIEIINVGGGLGINYNTPEKKPIAPFKEYFKIFAKNLKLRKGQEVHFELGQSVTGQCGYLISKVLYVNTSLRF